MMDVPVTDFFDTDAFFGKEVRLTTSSGSKLINVIFDDVGLQRNINGILVEITSPLITCITSDVESVVADGVSSVLIDDVTYYVLANKPNGTGISEIALSKDKP